MADFLDELTGDNDKGQSLKASEITGDRFMFHSLPKEFQDWHSNQFVMEQRATIDKNIVSKAVLNGYMWKVIYDGSFYAIITSLFMCFAILKMKISPDIPGLLIGCAVYFSWLAYLAYHFKFYAFIKAQAVGPVTTNSKEYIVDFFNSTFWLSLASLNVAFLVMVSFLEDIVDLLASLVNSLDHSGDSFDMWNDEIREVLVAVHNFLANILNGPTDTFGLIVFNQYITLTFLMAVTWCVVYFADKAWYTKHKVEVDYEIKKAKTASGYPIESALACLWEWREKHG